jgi:hypothetical protein
MWRRGEAYLGERQVVFFWSLVQKAVIEQHHGLWYGRDALVNFNSQL